MALDKDTAELLLERSKIALGYLDRLPKKGMDIRIAADHLRIAIKAAEESGSRFTPTMIGLHGNVSDFGMHVELCYVVKADGNEPIASFLRDHEHFRRNGMQRDTPQTVVAKLRALARWIEEHT